MAYNPMKELFNNNIYLWATFSMCQFLFTPLVMLLELKLSKKMFGVFALYSLNMLVFFKLFNLLDKNYHEFLLTYNLGAFDKTNQVFQPTLEYTVFATIIYISIFILIIGMIDRKRSLKIFVWYLLYAIYTLTWIPITIQGIIDKDKKEWSHTKHMRQIGIQEVE